MEKSPIGEFLDKALEEFERHLRKIYSRENANIRIRAARKFVKFITSGELPRPGERLNS
jgi:hypothetical protein